MGEKPQSFKEITPEMIRDWKAKYGEYALEEVSIPINQVTKGQKQIDPLVCARFVVRTPAKNEINAVAAYDGKPDKQNELLIENCVLGGDMKMIDQYGIVYAKLVQWGSDKIDAYTPYTSKKL